MKELGGLSWENQFLCLIGLRVSPRLLACLTLTHAIPTRPVSVVSLYPCIFMCAGAHTHTHVHSIELRNKGDNLGT